MGQPLAPSDLLIAVAALGVAFGVTQTLRLWLRGALTRHAFRARCAHATRGEARAEGLLSGRGYEILGRQATGSWTVRVDGSDVPVEVRADYLVERGGRRFVAEVKTGHAAPRIQSSATRRQLLEYRFAFEVDGVLLVDAEADTVREVVFPLPSTPLPSRLVGRVLAVLAFVAGLTLGAMATEPLRAAASSLVELASRAETALRTL